MVGLSRRLYKGNQKQSIPSSKRTRKQWSFFKIIHPLIIRDQQLGIPRKFVRNLGKELSDVAVLKVPNGKVWDVSLKKTEGEIWFGNGWHDFVEYHSIRVGYFLVFRYDGNSHFYVSIFDTSACEIDYVGGSDNIDENYGEHCLKRTGVGGRTREKERGRSEKVSFYLKKQIEVVPIDTDSSSDESTTSSPQSLSSTGGHKATLDANKDIDAFESNSLRLESKQDGQCPTDADTSSKEPTTSSPQSFSSNSGNMVTKDHTKNINAFEPNILRPESRLDRQCSILKEKEVEEENSLEILFTKTVNHPPVLRRSLRTSVKSNLRNSTNLVSEVKASFNKRKTGSFIHPKRLSSEFDSLAGNENKRSRVGGTPINIEQDRGEKITFNYGNLNGQCPIDADLSSKEPTTSSPQSLSSNGGNKVTCDPTKSIVAFESNSLGLESRHDLQGSIINEKEIGEENSVEILFTKRVNHLPVLRRSLRSSVKSNLVNVTNIVCEVETSFNKRKPGSFVHPKSLSSEFDYLGGNESKISRVGGARIKIEQDRDENIENSNNELKTFSSHLVSSKGGKHLDPTTDAVVSDNQGKQSTGTNGCHLEIIQELGMFVSDHNPRPLPRSMTWRQDRERAIQAAREFKSENPFCSVLMRPTYVTKTNMHIPYKFMETYTRMLNYLTLVVWNGGRRWPCEVLLYRDRCEVKISAGWNVFATENNLKVGDVCVFELINAEKNVFNVTIFRATPDAVLPQIGAAEQNAITTSV